MKSGPESGPVRTDIPCRWWQYLDVSGCSVLPRAAGTFEVIMMRSNNQGNIREQKEQLLRAGEVAEMLAVSSRLVWRFRSEGKLPAVQIAGATRFRLSDVERLIEAGAKGAEK